MVSSQSTSAQPLAVLCEGPKNARFSPVVTLPHKDPDDFFVTIGQPNDLNKSIQIKAENMTESLKQVFFPFGESFRIYHTAEGIRCDSPVDFVGGDCDTDWDYVLRQVHMAWSGQAWIFTKVSM